MRTNCPTTGKVQHGTEEDAQETLVLFRKKFPDYNGSPYFCLYCYTWHLGRKSEPQKKKRKRS